MTQSVVVGAGFPLTSGQVGGGINAHTMGNQVVITPSGSGDVTISLMFLISGEKTYETITVNSDVYSQDMPANTTYIEFNIQSVALGAEYLRMEIWQNS